MSAEHEIKLDKRTRILFFRTRVIFFYLLPVIFGLIVLTRHYYSYIPDFLSNSPTFKYILCALIIFPSIAIFYTLIITRNTIKDLEELERTRKQMVNLVDPNRMYRRLGGDTLCLLVSSNLICLAEPDQDGRLLFLLAALKENLTDSLGYIIPNFRIMDSQALGDNQFEIEIHENSVLKGCVYPDKYMVSKERYLEICQDKPNDCIEGLAPFYHTEVYWIQKKNKKTIESKLKYADAARVIVNATREALIAHAHEVFSIEQLPKYIETARTLCKDSSFIDEYVLKRLTLFDIKTILANLVKEKFSIKDIGYIFEKMGEYAQFSNDTWVITQKIKNGLKSVNIEETDLEKYI